MENNHCITISMVRTLLALVAVQPYTLFANLSVPGLFSDGMVLQRNKPLAVWGHAQSEESVSVEFQGITRHVTAGTDGKWCVQLPESEAGGPYTLTVKGNNTVMINDVMIGEVFLAGGQSNMVFRMRIDANGKTDMNSTNLPGIRFYTVPREVDPNHTEISSWVKAVNPADIGNFCAVGFYFARDLHAALGIPVGIVTCSMGSSPAEAWMSEASLDAIDSLSYLADKYRANRDIWKKGELVARKNPVILYQSMFNRIIPYTVKGVIWYQGESNSGRGLEYRTLLPALIELWRNDLQDPNLPFYIVQLSSWEKEGKGWPEIREAQLLTYMNDYRRSGLAVTMDYSNRTQIHPTHKKPVGERLALIARNRLFGESDLVYSGPIYKSHEINGNEILIDFYFNKGLKVEHGDSLSDFEISGADRRFGFVPAKAEIVGDRVRVWSDSVSQPKHVRYLWKMYAMPSLYNEAGLPASPFRTYDVTYPVMEPDSISPGPCSRADFRMIIESALEKGEKNIRIPRGTYTLMSEDYKSVTLRDLKDISIDANGSTIICKKPSRAFDLINCKTCVLQTSPSTMIRFLSHREVLSKWTRREKCGGLWKSLRGTLQKGSHLG